jgi:hypothetical protein
MTLLRPATKIFGAQPIPTNDVLPSFNCYFSDSVEVLLLVGRKLLRQIRRGCLVHSGLGAVDWQAVVTTSQNSERLTVRKRLLDCVLTM